MLLDTYRAVSTAHPPSRVLADLAVVIADGGDALCQLATLRDQDKLFGALASDATAWRCLARVDGPHLAALRAVRVAARKRAWAAGAGPELAAGLVIDLDATITIAHSDKENAAKTWKRKYGFHPLLAFLDRPELAGGEALAALLRPGDAGSNTTADHITVLDEALAALPAHTRPRPAELPAAANAPRVLIRTDAAGATHGFAAACRDRGCLAPAQPVTPRLAGDDPISSWLCGWAEATRKSRHTAHTLSYRQSDEWDTLRGPCRRSEGYGGESHRPLPCAS